MTPRFLIFEPKELSRLHNLINDPQPDAAVRTNVKDTLGLFQRDYWEKAHPGELWTLRKMKMPKMPADKNRIKVGRCYRMTIGGKLIVAKVIQIYPLDIGIAEEPEEDVRRWAWSTSRL